jgi:hypothetical protein
MQGETPGLQCNPVLCRKPTRKPEDHSFSVLSLPHGRQGPIPLQALTVFRQGNRRAIEFDKADFRLSETTPFHWRRNLPPLNHAPGHVSPW